MWMNIRKHVRTTLSMNEFKKRNWVFIITNQKTCRRQINLKKKMKFLKQKLISFPAIRFEKPETNKRRIY